MRRRFFFLFDAFFCGVLGPRPIHVSAGGGTCLRAIQILKSSTTTPDLPGRRQDETGPVSLAKGSAKTPTGIAGFDEITGGGLPRGRTTLLVGGVPAPARPYSRCNSWCMARGIARSRASWSLLRRTPKRIVANAESFGASVLITGFAGTAKTTLAVRSQTWMCFGNRSARWQTASAWHRLSVKLASSTVRRIVGTLSQAQPYCRLRDWKSLRHEAAKITSCQGRD